MITKKIKYLAKIGGITSVLALFAYASVFAQQELSVSLPYTFSEGETISAEQMNANFEALADAVRELQPVAEKFGNYAGRFLVSGDFSAIAGSNGAAGKDAASEMCATLFPDSKAVLDSEKLGFALIHSTMPKQGDSHLHDGARYWIDTQEKHTTQTTLVSGSCLNRTSSDPRDRGLYITRTNFNSNGVDQVKSESGSCDDPIYVACFID